MAKKATRSGKRAAKRSTRPIPATYTFGQPILNAGGAVSSTRAPDDKTLSMIFAPVQATVQNGGRGLGVLDVRVPVTFSSPGVATMRAELRGAVVMSGKGSAELWSLSPTPKRIGKWAGSKEFTIVVSDSIDVPVSAIVQSGPAPTGEFRLALALLCSAREGAAASLEVDTADCTPK